MLKGSSALTRVCPKVKKLVERHAHLVGEVAEIFLHHRARERVVACGHWRVRGENVRGGDELQRSVEVESLSAHAEPNAFQREEGRVAFVHVEDFGIDPERGERVHTADAEHDFLPHPHFQIAAVELRA